MRRWKWVGSRWRRTRPWNTATASKAPTRSSLSETRAMALDQDPRRMGQPLPPEAPGEAPHDPAAQQLSQSALEHYQRGNRYFDLKALDQALAEWRRST